MNIWIINPFDELPGDTDVRHRYWSLADTLAGMGHEVTWWSSDFSHRQKRTRDKGRGSRVESLFALRLISTPPYRKNVSWARIRNHRQYAQGFLNEAREGIRSGAIAAPDRMVVSLPPLGTADAAFALRDEFGGEVIVDIMDAWPETFYRAFPKWVPHPLRKLILLPLHRSAERAYRGADRISAVSQTYIELAKASRGTRDKGQGSFHLCYHGIDWGPSTLVPRPLSTNPRPSSLVLTYIGALERSYDLETAIRAVHELNAEGCQVELHIAGAGSQEASLKQFASSLVPRPLSLVPKFHGLLDSEGLRALLSRSHAGLIPMQQDSWVGLPYKLADYCAAGLPVISSLDGECRRLLDTKKAGLFYEPGNLESLKSVINECLQNLENPSEYGQNALTLAEEHFDRKKTYPELATFIVG